MPLRLNLKPHEKVFIGGAVVVNGATRAELTLLNDIAVLRQSDILTEASADTPCKKLYFLIQLMYMDSPNLVEYHAKYWAMAETIMAEQPASSDLIDAMTQEVVLSHYYRALRIGKKLIAAEKEWMQHAQ